MTNPSLDQNLGIRPFGGPVPARPGLTVQIDGKAFTQASEAQPVPVTWGSQRRAGSYILPLFAVRATPIKQKVSKGKTVTTGYNYFGSFVVALGIGPATRLTRITNGETEIWSGDVDQTSRDGDGKTVLTTTLGSIRFYWGRADQNADDYLTAASIDFGAGPTSILIPAWRNVIYAVAVDIALGTTPKEASLKYEFERQISPLTLTAHQISDDAVVPEAIYELLNSSLFGAGIDAANLDLASFEAAGETVITEAIGVSPWLDENLSVREYLGRLLAYIDGYLRYDAGLIKLELIRKQSTVGIPTIDETLLADEPKPTNEGWQNTWNFTRAVFTDRENEWEDSAVELYDDAANAAITGERTDQELQIPFVTRRAVAKILVKRKALKGGLPAMTWELEVLPSLRSLKPGSLAFLTFTKRGITNRLVRIIEANRSAHDNRLIRLTVQEEITRDESHDFVIPNDSFQDHPQEFSLASTLPRLSWLTTELKEGQPDGFLVACERPLPLIEGFETYFTWDPVGQEYRKLAASNAMPAKGELIYWTVARNNQTFILRIVFQNSDDAKFAIALLSDGADFFAAVGRRLYKTVGTPIDEHQVDVLWFRGVAGGYLNPISATEIEMEFEGAAFGSDLAAMETESEDGNYPTLHIYVGREVDFTFVRGSSFYFERLHGNAPVIYGAGGVPLPYDADTDRKRYIAAPTYNAARAQEIVDAGVTVYDRDDTMMCPDGTYDNDWGARVPTLAERYDAAAFAEVFNGVHPDSAIVADADSDLFNVVFGADSIDQFVLVEDTDKVLGFMTSTGATWYNKQ